MRLVMTLLVRDEEELLEDNLDYHLNRGVDLVLATDHASRDATPEILRRYEREGVLASFREEGEGYQQAAIVTRMARLAAVEHGADWVFHDDADEFWWPQAGSLKDVLAGIPDELGVVEVPRRNFLAVAEGDGPFHQWMTFREVESRNPLGYALEPKVAHRAHPDARVTQGAHSVELPGGRPAPRLPLIEVFHFPVRSYAQFERKVVNTGEAYERAPDLPAELGRDQRALYELYKAGALPERFRELVVDADELRTGLESGRFIDDRRLAGFMRAAARPARAPEPDEGAREFARWTLARVDHLEREEERLTARVLALGEEQAEVQRRTIELGDAYGEALAQLEEVRNSRLMRWTAPARRLIYRLRG